YDPVILQTRYRKDLAGQLGNLVSRSTSLALNPSSTVPCKPLIIEGVNEKDMTLYKMLQQLPDLVSDHYKNVEFGKGLELIFETIAEANKHFTDNEPWNLIKDPNKKEILNRVLFFAVETARISGILLQPIMPTKMKELLDMIGVSNDERRWEHSRLGSGWQVKGGGS
ncbi:28217_t:CDS:2, partial [Racocetra persica]